MSDDKQRKPFNEASQGETPAFRDKDNAAPRVPPPEQATKPAPNLAPPGMMGIRTSITAQQQPVTHAKPEVKLPALDQGNAWRFTDGKLLSMPGYSFAAKLTETPDKSGLDGGTVEQLVVTKDGRQVALYDREWKQEPRTPEQKEAVHRIRSGLDDSQERAFKGFEPGKDKGLGWER